MIYDFYYQVIGEGQINNSEQDVNDSPPKLHYHSMSEYALELAKMFRLLKNEKTLLLTHEDMFTKLSLILSRIQKDVLGDGDIDVSDVLDAFNKVKDVTMSKNKENGNLNSLFTDDIPQRAAKEYLLDLKSQNLIDPWVLLSKLEAWFENDETNIGKLKMMGEVNVLIVLSDQFNDSKLPDSQMAKLLFPENTFQLKKATLENEGVGENITNEEKALSRPEWVKIGWQDAFISIEDRIKTATLKRDENYHLQLFLGYLKLLTNSRDELALAKVLCGAGGVLNHDAFNVLKKESLQTRMPMYQVSIKLYYIIDKIALIFLQFFYLIDQCKY